MTRDDAPHKGVQAGRGRLSQKPRGDCRENCAEKGDIRQGWPSAEPDVRDMAWFVINLRGRLRRVAGPLGLAFAAGFSLGACKEAAPAGPGLAPSASAKAPAVCVKGRSVDPPRSELQRALADYDQRQYEAAAQQLGRLRDSYPESATVRIWRAEVALIRPDGEYMERANLAERYYAEAQKLVELGCAPPEPAAYALALGIALVRLRKKDPEGALGVLEKALETWQNSAELHYNLARVTCALGKLEACAEHFSKTLALAKAHVRPIFIRNHNSLDDWIRRSKTQSEFPALRADPRYEEMVQRAQGRRGR